MEALYGEIATDQLMTHLDDLRVDDRVGGVVIDVEQDLAVAKAYQAWDAHLTETDYANAVTDAIRQLISGELDIYPNVEHLVLVGDDRVIPFRRVSDHTRYPESNYTNVLTSTTVGQRCQTI